MQTDILRSLLISGDLPKNVTSFIGKKALWGRTPHLPDMVCLPALGRGIFIWPFSSAVAGTPN